MKDAKQKVVSLGDTKFGHFVTICEYQFYKGLMYFYDGKYESASKNFRRAA